MLTSAHQISQDGGGERRIHLWGGTQLKILLRKYGAFMTPPLRALRTIESRLISESTTNNRVKSGHSNRGTAPIDMVPQAGARSGMPNGVETTGHSVAVEDLEDGRTLSPSSPHPQQLSPKMTSQPGS